MQDIINHYDILKVSESAPPEVIKAAYKTLSQKHHPDKNPGDSKAAEFMQKINEAHHVLSNADLRKNHDAELETRKKQLLREQFLKMQAHARASVKPPPSASASASASASEKTREPRSASILYSSSYVKLDPHNIKKTSALIMIPLRAAKHARRHLLPYLLVTTAAAFATYLFNSKPGQNISTAEYSVSKAKPTTNNQFNSAASSPIKNSKPPSSRSIPKPEKIKNQQHLVKYKPNVLIENTSKTILKNQRYLQERNRTSISSQKEKASIENIVEWPSRNDN